MDRLSKVIKELQSIVTHIETTEFQNYQVGGDKFLVNLLLNEIDTLILIRNDLYNLLEIN